MGQLSQFTKTLIRELQLTCQLAPWAGQTVSTIYFGGGTPSLHSVPELADVIATVRSLWTVVLDAEVTLETNPGTVDEVKLRSLAAAGVNRLSIGAQSFSPRKLDLLYRDHTVDDVYACVKAARAAGITNLSLDLIFGLPEETEHEWQRDIDAALDLNPEHVSLYNLEIHEQTPFARWQRQGKLESLSADFEADLYLLTHGRLTAAGFDHYEVSNFARPGYRSRHNRSYWLGAPYLGCGPSAHSYDGLRTRSKNIADDSAWTSSLAQGNLARDDVWKLTEQELLEEWISLALRRSEGITREGLVNRWGQAFAAQIWQQGRQLPADICEISETEFKLTPAGWFRENSILTFLFAALRV